MNLSQDAITRFRLMMQNSDLADEILSYLNDCIFGQVMINRIIDTTITVQPNYTFLLTNPTITNNGEIVLPPEAELMVI